MGMERRGGGSWRFLILARAEESLQIVTSVPGVWLKVGSVTLAEIEDVGQFIGPKQLVSWAGLTPAVYTSRQE